MWFEYIWPWAVTLTLTASAITRFYGFDRNFFTIRRRNLILVSRVGFWGSRNPMVPLDFNLTLTLTLFFTILLTILFNINPYGEIGLWTVRETLLVRFTPDLFYMLGDPMAHLPLEYQWPWAVTLTLTVSTIMRFCSFNCNFLNIRRRNLILVSRVGFWGSRNPLVPLDFHLTLTLTLTIFTKYTAPRVNGLYQKDCYTDMHPSCTICNGTPFCICGMTFWWPWPLTLTLILTRSWKQFICGLGKTAEPIHTKFVLYGRWSISPLWTWISMTLSFNLDLDSVRHYPILQLWP